MVLASPSSSRCWRRGSGSARLGGGTGAENLRLAHGVRGVPVRHVHGAPRARHRDLGAPAGHLAAALDAGLADRDITAVLGVALVVATLVKMIDDNEFQTGWAWIGLAIALAIMFLALIRVRYRWGTRRERRRRRPESRSPPPVGGAGRAAPDTCVLDNIRGRPGLDVVGSPVKQRAEVAGRPRKTTGTKQVRSTISHSPPSHTRSGDVPPGSAQGRGRGANDRARYQGSANRLSTTP